MLAQRATTTVCGHKGRVGHLDDIPEARLVQVRYVDDDTEFVELLDEAATKAGHTWATVRRAKAALGITSEKQGMQGPWVWQLPAKMLTDSEDAHPTDVSPFEENEHLREPDDDLQQTITDLLSRHPKGLSNEEVAVILKVPLIKVKAVRGNHG